MYLAMYLKAIKAINSCHGRRTDLHGPAQGGGRLRQGEDVFTLDRLIDAAANIGITVRMTATRPYDQE